MERFSGLEAFVAVVEQGSFTAAAKVLGVSKSYVSKQVSALEDRLGARLMNRTTRSLSLTSAGKAFHERCAAILIEIEEAEQAVTQLQSEPRGVLRTSVPVSFGLQWIAPLVAEFLCLHDELEIDLDFSDRRVDIIDEGFDVVIRVGVLDDSSFAARRIAPVRVLLCATPQFVQEHGPVTTPEQLNPRHCLAYTYQSAATWRFSKGGKDHYVRIDGRLQANNGDALAHACAQGLGFAMLPDFLVQPYLQDGTVVSVLEDWIDNDRLGVWAVYPHSRHLSAKVRGFIDFLVEKFEPCPWAAEVDKSSDSHHE